jgi:methionine aminotransferase
MPPFPETKLPKVGTTIFTVMSALAAEHGAVNLGQGFPDFPPPEPLVEALARAMADGRNQYAPMAGVPALREAIARKTLKDYGRTVDPGTEITVTSGATEAIFDAIHATVRAGEEVIVLDPCYDCYEPAIELAGARAVHVPLDGRTFAPDWERVKAAISRRTRMLMINSPHNPAGVVLSAEDMRELAEILRGTRVLLLSDEVYEHIVYDGRRHESVLRFPELAERAFVVSSFGKTYHCTGWKVGYAVAPAPLTAEFRKVHQFVTFATHTPAQHAFAEMLEKHPGHHETLGAFYQPRRDAFAARLRDTKLRPLPVPGGYFQLVDYSAASDLDDAAFCRWLTIEKGVAAIPLSPFYEKPPPGQRLARLCFAKVDRTLEAGLARLRGL